MYSGFVIFSKYSGAIMGGHQKIDRLARRQVEQLVPGTNFPAWREILKFEGQNGPDGIKSKSPGKDEPWHYIDPFDESDTELYGMLQDHYNSLVKALKKDDTVRASFEAAWLAHAIVDGLTPAHHYPYEEELSKLRGGEGLETRTTVKKKLLMTGDTRREKLKNNWKMWGARGLYTSHASFELGVAFLIKPLTFSDAIPTPQELKQAHKLGVVQVFHRSAREIGVLEMYDSFLRKGWTPRLAWQVRHKLGPTIVRTVTFAWYSALIDAGKVS
jgi:hypothetical protein